MKYKVEEIGKIIKSEREKHGWTRVDLGKKLGITGKQVSCYEKGNPIPPIDMMLKLCDVFGVELGYLLGEEIYSSGTQIDTAIETRCGLTTKSINNLSRISRHNRQASISPSDEEEYEELLNSFISSDSFYFFMNSLHDVYSVYKEIDSIWDDLITKYGKEHFYGAMECYNSTIDYIHDEDAPKIPDSYYEIMLKIESKLDVLERLEYRRKVYSYETKEIFEDILNCLFKH